MSVNVNLPGMSFTFPDVPPSEIWRDNLLTAVETICADDTKVVVVQGQPGIGKTTLLSQFARKKSRNAISHFVRASTRITYDIDMLRNDLLKQVYWVLHGDSLDDGQPADEGELRKYLAQLVRRARQRDEVYYFIVDGLEDIIDTHPEVCETILSMLEIGLGGFRYLLSGNVSHYRRILPGSVPVQPFQLPPFDSHQTAAFLASVGVSEEDSIDLHRALRGVPGYLASVRRIIRGGKPVADLLSEMPNELGHLFDIEWSNVDPDDPLQQKLLGVLAWSNVVFTCERLADLLGVAESDVRKRLEGLQFIDISGDQGQVSFVADAIREYAQNKLHAFRQEALELIITRLQANPDSDEAVSVLPTHLVEAGRHDDLIEYLSPDHFANMLGKNGAVEPVKQRARLGIQSATEVGRDGDLLRFGTKHALLTELSKIDVWRSEVEARLALNDYDAALGLAQTAALTEDRLYLLSIIARKKRENGLEPEPELLEQIDQLFATMAHPVDKHRAVEIASELIHSRPKLAIELVEKAADVDDADDGLDWAFAVLSVAAIGSSKGEASSDTVESIKLRIRNPELREVSEGASLLLGERSASELLAEVNKFDKPSWQIFLLQQWASFNPRRDGAADVVQHAVNLAIRTTGFVLNARVLRNLAKPLPYVRDEQKLAALVAVFDGQKDVVERTGPTEEYVALQLELARAEKRCWARCG